MPLSKYIAPYTFFSQFALWYLYVHLIFFFDFPRNDDSIQDTIRCSSVEEPLFIPKYVHLGIGPF
jgi:hypothetical protein